ncbi:hypothetical protein BH09MYX1_BH09MYX1_56930 [soil metagenome]
MMRVAMAFTLVLAGCGGDVVAVDGGSDASSDSHPDALFVCGVPVSPYEAKVCVECGPAYRVRCQEVCLPIRPKEYGACDYSPQYDGGTVPCGAIRCGVGCTCALPDQSICECPSP